MASGRGLLNRLKKLEARQQAESLGLWLIVGIRGRAEDENEQDHEAFCTMACEDAKDKTGQTGTIIAAPLDFWRDPRHPPLPAAVYDKGYTYDGDPDPGGWLVG